MLRKKLLRDIKQNISQFITIFLMVFLGVFVFSGIHAYMDGMSESGSEYYKNNNLEDIWLTGENFTSDDLNNVKKLDNINDAERVLTITTTLKDFDDVTLETNFIESNNISKLYIVDGEEYQEGKSGVWFDSYLANYLDLKVGDTITFTYQKYEITETIKGLVNSPDHVYGTKDDSVVFPSHKDYGFIYLSINEFPEEYINDSLISNTGINNIDLIKKNIKDFDYSNYYIFNQIIVDIKDTDKLNETKADIENSIDSALAVTDRESSASYEGYQREIEEGDTYSSVFTFLFLFIAVLSVITTMNRFVKKQRTQIGTLKALGFKDNKITRHYISYGFYISLIAAILGVLVGRYTLGYFFLNMEMSYFEIPVYHTVTIPTVYVLALIVVVLVTLISYLSCKKILKEPASESLRLQIPKVKNTKFTLTTKGVFKKSSMSTKWNIRDISRNKSRSIMAIVGIMGSCMLLVCAFGMLDTMNSYIDWEFKTIQDYKYKLNIDSDITDNEYNDLINKYGDETSSTLGVEIQNGSKKETKTLLVNDGTNYLKTTDHNKKVIDLKDNGMYITEKMADSLSLEVGDEIKWHIFGDSTWYTSEIVGLNRDPQIQGLTMTRDYYESLNLTYKADSLYTNEDLSDVKEISGVDTIQSIDTLQESMQSMLGTMKSMIVLLIFVAALLGTVIIYNLGIMSFSEKQYQFATLKVLGFKDKQIRKIYIKQNSWLTIIAIILGLPLGYLMTSYIFTAALGDNYDFPAYITILSYLYAVVGTYLVSFIVNKLLARKVNNIDMVSSLKGNE